MIRGIHLAQIVDVHPEQYEVSVVFPHMAQLRGIRVGLGGAFQGPNSGTFLLPEPGWWALVAFPQEDARSGRIIAYLPDLAYNVIPTDLLKEDPQALAEFYSSGAHRILHGDGTLEMMWPDGTLLTVGYRHEATPRKKTRRKGQRWTPPSQETASPSGPPVAVKLRHKSGAQIEITEDGAIRIYPAGGKTLELAGTIPNARKGDEVEVTIPPGTVMVPSPTGPIPNPTPITLRGRIVQGSDIVKSG